MSDSVLVKSQVRSFSKDYESGGKKYRIYATVRHDDSCGNGHNTFSVTGEIKRNVGGDRWVWESGGCLHEEIARHFPDLAPLLKWHLCGTDQPLHYVANTIYLAGDRDCWGLRKDEVRQLRNGKTGRLSWKLEATDSLPQYVDSDEQPTATATLRYVPWNRIGEGKERELDAARRAAIWPEATDEDLTADGLKERLLARHSQLMADFRAAVESLGMVY